MKYLVIHSWSFAFSVFIANADMEAKLDDAFAGFEKRSEIRGDSKLFIYTRPPISVYADGGTTISGVKVILKDNTIEKLSPIIKKKAAPALEVIYSKVQNNVSLSEVLSDSGFDHLDANQIYYIIINWCQASVIFGKGDAKLGLTTEQKKRIERDCGIQEVLDLIKYEEKKISNKHEKLGLLINILKKPM